MDFGLSFILEIYLEEKGRARPNPLIHHQSTEFCNVSKETTKKSAKASAKLPHVKMHEVSA